MPTVEAKKYVPPLKIPPDLQMHRVAVNVVWAYPE